MSQAVATVGTAEVRDHPWRDRNLGLNGGAKPHAPVRDHPWRDRNPLGPCGMVYRVAKSVIIPGGIATAS